VSIKHILAECTVTEMFWRNVEVLQERNSPDYTLTTGASDILLVDMYAKDRKISII
jgi:hypothetical protein